VITEERIEQLVYEFVNDSDGTLGDLQNALRNAAEESYRSGYAAGDRAARQECAEICSKVHLLGTPNNFQAKICKERIEATIKELTT
jgi:hypothetical protein